MKSTRVAFLVSVVLLSTLVPAVPSNAATCGPTPTNPRSYDKAYGVLNARGVTSKVTTPPSGEITGSGVNKPSAGDVFLYYSWDFVQVGWYVGSAGDLPYSPTPRVFVGEAISSTGSEVLRAGPSLNWNTNYKFTIQRSSSSGAYEFLLDGVHLFDSLYLHMTQGRPGSVGEIAYPCTRMYHRAVTPAPAAPTLYFTTNGTTWNDFTDAYSVLDPGGITIVSTDAGSTATHFGYGGGS